MSLNKQDIVFVGAARTPIGSYLGGLKTVPVEELSLTALEAALTRSGIDKKAVDEIIVGNVIGSQTSNNIARIIGIDGNFPKATTGMTINRICGSGIQSAISAAQSLLLGDAEVIAAGGAESMSRAPFYLPENARYEGIKSNQLDLIDANAASLHSVSGKANDDLINMGLTAENIVDKYAISREAQDNFAYLSQQKAKKAIETGRLATEIVPVTVKGRKGQTTNIDADEHPRPMITLEKLSQLKPAFRGDGTGSVTAGTASGFNDGAAFEILTTANYAESHGLEPMGRLVDYAVVGCDPRLMGLGPVEAIKQILAKHQLEITDIDILEINEAFAGQVLGCLHELGVATDSDFYHTNFNPNGGAVALGHPLGMSGARLITSILYEFKAHPEKRYGLASACIGGGQGIAMLLENPLVK